MQDSVNPQSKLDVNPEKQRSLLFTCRNRLIYSVNGLALIVLIFEIFGRFINISLKNIVANHEQVLNATLSKRTPILTDRLEHGCRGQFRTVSSESEKLQVGQYGRRPVPHNAEHAQYDKRSEINIAATASINQSNYFILRPKVDQRAGQLILPHAGITKTEKQIQ